MEKLSGGIYDSGGQFTPAREGRCRLFDDISGIAEGRCWVGKGPKTVEKKSVENLENDIHRDRGAARAQQGGALNQARARALKVNWRSD